LQAGNIIGESIVVYGNVLHEFCRVFPAPVSVEQRARIFPGLPQAFLLFSVKEGVASTGHIPNGSVRAPDLIADLVWRFADVLEQENGGSAGRQDVAIFGQGIKRQVNQCPIHQLTRGDSAVDYGRNRPGHLFERIKLELQ
jgi:hypothetical protein